ncbi:DUF7555 family protein [Halomarina rubra]|uniref:Preprotein translocase subunit SecE n=1 Tax=Halomarina rubra TaxID=2071873 RepID=A0ABD6ATF0_9EURY|nr:hypothetical protein [Halomarina rubra]
MADRSATPEEFDGSGADRPRQLVDLVAYSLSVLVVLFVVLGAVSVALGGGLVGVKRGLFVVGMLLFGLAALKLRPTRLDKRDEARLPADRGRETPFQSRVQRVIPSAYRLDHDDRLSDALKLFVASLLVLAVSYVMETVFGIAVS